MQKYSTDKELRKHNKEENNKCQPEITSILEFSDKDLKADIITIIHEIKVNTMK